MSEESLPTQPKELERYLDRPYGGLFGDTVTAQVVEEIVADPPSDCRPRDLEESIGASPPAARKAPSTLASLGLRIKDAGDRQHPVYRVNTKSKKVRGFDASGLRRAGRQRRQWHELHGHSHRGLLQPTFHPISSGSRPLFQSSRK
jgi:hypothetical protein